MLLTFTRPPTQHFHEDWKNWESFLLTQPEHPWVGTARPALPWGWRHRDPLTSSLDSCWKKSSNYGVFLPPGPAAAFLPPGLHGFLRCCCGNGVCTKNSRISPNSCRVLCSLGAVMLEGVPSVESLPGKGSGCSFGVNSGDSGQCPQ